MIKLRVSSLASDDLQNIGRYTLKKWGLQQRNHYLLQFDNAFKKLLENPQLGRSCDEIIEGYRRLQEGQHIICYRFNEQFLDIIRILHQHMDVDNHLNSKANHASQ